jgi:hypothetical protein
MNERRGDPRGKNGQLIVHPEGALAFSPNYQKWRERADAIDYRLRQQEER